MSVYIAIAISMHTTVLTLLAHDHLHTAADILATPSVYGSRDLYSSLVHLFFVDQRINCTRFSINKVAKEAKVFLASAS